MYHHHRWQEVRAKRDAAEATRCLAELSAAAKRVDREGHNLLALAVDAARARCTVGEISDALEAHWGRYAAAGDMATGTYASSLPKTAEREVAECAAAVERFERTAGRRPRILVAKMGMDGHDRGAKVMATG